MWDHDVRCVRAGQYSVLVTTYVMRTRLVCCTTPRCACGTESSCGTTTCCVCAGQTALREARVSSRMQSSMYQTAAKACWQCVQSARGIILAFYFVALFDFFPKPIHVPAFLPALNMLTDTPLNLFSMVRAPLLTSRPPCLRPPPIAIIDLAAPAPKKLASC